jgi:hypothetical protein
LGGSTLQKDVTFIWMVQTIKHLHQCAFSGSIFTQQGMHLTGSNVKINPIIGKYTREALGYAAHFQVFDPGSAGRKNIFHDDSTESSAAGSFGSPGGLPKLNLYGITAGLS